jgi:hypothetical protein
VRPRPHSPALICRLSANGASLQVARCNLRENALIRSRRQQCAA